MRHEPRLSREEERGAGAVERHQDDQVPEARVMRDQEPGRDPLRAEPDEIGRDHHQVPRQAVGPDAPDEEEDHRR